MQRVLITAGANGIGREFARAFAANGWLNPWRDGIFTYHHFHSTSHEVLGIAAGEVRVAFGGPGGRVRRSAMKASNSALSLAKRSRSRKEPKSFCSSSMRRSVSALYSSNARLPDVGGAFVDGPHAQALQWLQGPPSWANC